MISVVMQMLLSWMPERLGLIAAGIVALFVIFTMLHLIRFILDLIPFL